MRQSELIKKHRIQRGLTQKELGQLVWPDFPGGSQFVSNIELNRSNLPPYKINEMAKALGIDAKILQKVVLKDLQKDFLARVK